MGMGNKNMLISGGGGGWEVKISKFLFPGGGGVEISTAINYTNVEIKILKQYLTVKIDDSISFSTFKCIFQK